MQIELASYNIQHGVGKDNRLDLDRIAAELGNADIIALQEVEVANPYRGLLDQPREIARRLPHKHWVYGPTIDIYLAEEPIHGEPYRRQQFGNLILSRWPILSVVNHTLPKLALPGTLHLQQAMMETIIQTPASSLRFCTTHLDHVSPVTRMPQVRALCDIMLDVERRGAPFCAIAPAFSTFAKRPLPWPSETIIMGDMNFGPDSAEYDYLFGEPFAIGRGSDIGKARLFDAWVISGHDKSDGHTATRPDRAALRIDHCFVTGGLVPAVQSMRIDENAIGSDHQPIFVSIVLSEDNAV
jgi:endonuclease/exonuclease/phosphatase family metal-dependent hydrolase